MKLTKRDATPEEEEKTLLENAQIWNLHNPSFQMSIDAWRQKLAEAKTQGYKSEVCECGVIYLAFHHFVSCQRKDCPFSDGVTLLERLNETTKGSN